MTVSSVNWRTSYFCPPCIPTPSSWVAAAWNILFPDSHLTMSSPPLGYYSHLTTLKAYPIYLVKKHPPSALPQRPSPLPCSILSIFHSTYHLLSYCTVTQYLFLFFPSLIVGYKHHRTRIFVFFSYISKSLEHCLMLNKICWNEWSNERMNKKGKMNEQEKGKQGKGTWESISRVDV